MQVSDGPRNDIFVYELGTGVPRQVTRDGAETRPLWTPDGKRLTYAARRKDQRHTFWQALDGSTEAQSLVVRKNDVWPGAWTPDGSALVFVESPPTEISDIKLPRPSDPSRIETVVDSPTEDMWPSLSPDGRWIIFSSMDRGRYQLYLRPIAGGAPIQITTDGGGQGRWAPDGREVFYRAANRLMRLSVQTSPELLIGKPEELFAGAYHAVPDGPPNYDVSPDGQRFFMVKPGDQERAAAPIHVVLDWLEALKRRAPVPR